VELHEEHPASFAAEMSRRHRWIRGDWQIAGWLLPRVLGPSGKRAPNSLTALAWWKIFDNLRRSLTPVAMLLVLLGKEDDTGTMQNPRKLPFLTIETGKNRNKGGLIYSNGGAGGQIEGLYDAWGQPFFIKMDTEYEDEILDPLIQGNVVRNKKVIVYSYGADKRIGGGDDVKTW
jgi:hypothetical protein